MNDTPTPKNDQPTYAMLADMRDKALLAERELTAVTKQRDKSKSIAETAINDHEMSDIRNHKLTEQLSKANETIGTMIDEIGMLQLKDKATTEQRDRLAEALESIVGESAYEGLPESKQQAIEQALQSLNQNTPKSSALSAKLEIIVNQHKSQNG